MTIEDVKNSQRLLNQLSLLDKELDAQKEILGNLQTSLEEYREWLADHIKELRDE